MTSTSPIQQMFQPIDQGHPFVGKGLVSFSSVLASARSTGPMLDLGPDDLPGVRAADAPTPFTAPGPSSIQAANLPTRAQQWLGPIEAAATRHGLDPKLLTALVWTESAFRENALSPAGAIGLGQLMPGTAAGMGVDPHDPLDNLDGAATYLAQQLRSFGSVDLALAAYNAGPGRVQQSGGVPNIAETQAYVRIVTDRYQTLSKS